MQEELVEVDAMLRLTAPSPPGATPSCFTKRQPLETPSRTRSGSPFLSAGPRRVHGPSAKRSALSPGIKRKMEARFNIILRMSGGSRE